MTTLKNTLHDSNNGLDYTLVNDHYLPNLTAAAPTEQHPTGRWGRLHKRYLKEHHPIRYNQLLLSGELGSYLAKLDKQVEEQLALTVRQMRDSAVGVHVVATGKHFLRVIMVEILISFHLNRSFNDFEI